MANRGWRVWDQQVVRGVAYLITRLSPLGQTEVEAAQAAYVTVMKSCAAFMNDSPLWSVSAATVTSSRTADFLLRCHSSLSLVQIFFVKCQFSFLIIWLWFTFRYLWMLPAFPHSPHLFSIVAPQLLFFVPVVPLALLLSAPSLLCCLSSSQPFHTFCSSFANVYKRAISLMICIFILPYVSHLLLTVFLETKELLLLLNYPALLYLMGKQHTACSCCTCEEDHNVWAVLLCWIPPKFKSILEGSLVLLLLTLKKWSKQLNHGDVEANCTVSTMKLLLQMTLVWQLSTSPPVPE